MTRVARTSTTTSPVPSTGSGSVWTDSGEPNSVSTAAFISTSLPGRAAQPVDDDLGQLLRPVFRAGEQADQADEVVAGDVGPQRARGLGLGHAAVEETDDERVLLAQPGAGLARLDQPAVQRLADREARGHPAPDDRREPRPGVGSVPCRLLDQPGDLVV